jgi:hypothetical protein
MLLSLKMVPQQRLQGILQEKYLNTIPYMPNPYDKRGF